jgi:hypothetical protein
MAETDETSGASIRSEMAKKTGYKTAFVLAALGLVYGLFYLPELVVAFFKQHLHSIKTLLTSMGFSGTIAAALSPIITGQDVLATTNLKSARFFRAQYPSAAIKKRYGCTQAEADQLWFSIFNPWAEKTHPQHAQYVMTFERSYDCRFIFHVRWSVILIALLAAITWFVSWKFKFESASDSSALFTLQYTRGFLLGMALLIAGFMFSLNRLRPTGCWRLWQEINDIHKTWLEQAVFKHAPSYADALNLVEDPAWKQKWSYK